MSTTVRHCIQTTDADIISKPNLGCNTNTQAALHACCRSLGAPEGEASQQRSLHVSVRRLLRSSRCVAACKAVLRMFTALKASRAELQAGASQAHIQSAHNGRLHTPNFLSTVAAAGGWREEPKSHLRWVLSSSCVQCRELFLQLAYDFAFYLHHVLGQGKLSHQFSPNVTKSRHIVWFYRAIRCFQDAVCLATAELLSACEGHSMSDVNKAIGIGHQVLCWLKQRMCNA